MLVSVFVCLHVYRLELCEGLLCGVLLLKVLVVGFFRKELSSKGENNAQIYLSLLSHQAVLLAARCSGTTAWPSPHRKMMWGSLSHAASLHPDFCHLALGLPWPWDKCPVCTWPYPRNGLCWVLMDSGTSSASRWRGEKVNELLCSALRSPTAFYKALQRQFPVQKGAHNMLHNCQANAVAKSVQKHLQMCRKAFLDRDPEMLVCLCCSLKHEFISTLFL